MMSSELKRRDEERRSKMLSALGIGAGVTGGLAAKDAIRDIMHESTEGKMKPTKDWKRFLGMLEPGDVVFHRRPYKYSGKAELAGFEAPFTEADVLAATKGDPFYHSSIYRGKGLVTDAAGWEDGVKNSRLNEYSPEELRVYRPNVGSSERSRALRFLDDMKGAAYKSEAETVGHGVRHLFGGSVPTGSPACKLGKGGVVCTELTAEAYPKIFKDRLASPRAMRQAEELKLIAKYGSIPKMGMREKILSHGVYPVLKNSKWGLLAGAMGLGALALTGDSPRQSPESSLERWRKRNTD